jgi:hypothetical protein
MNVIIEEFEALKINSYDHIGGVESNTSDMIVGFFPKVLKMHGGNSFNSSRAHQRS